MPKHKYDLERLTLGGLLGAIFLSGAFAASYIIDLIAVINITTGGMK